MTSMWEPEGGPGSGPQQLWTRHVSLREWERSRPVPGDKIIIRNLQLRSNTGIDGWGRIKAQPVTLSLEGCLRNPASSSAASDTVDSSTVHYGELSKKLISVAESEVDIWLSPSSWSGHIFNALETPRDSWSSMWMEVYFPKATLLGDGVGVHCYGTTVGALQYCCVVELKRLRIPALIGVNEHERTAKQAVVVSVWIDRAENDLVDRIFEAEQIVTKTVEESSFETLEALAEAITANVIKYYIFAKKYLLPDVIEGAGVRVRIEKPDAIIQADWPAVEIYRSAEMGDAFGRKMASELGNKRPQLPFPLGGSMKQFLQLWKQD